MTKPTDDELLRDAFQELRAETRASGRAPDFGHMLEAARRQVEGSPALEVVSGTTRWKPSRRLLRGGAWTSAALAAGVAALVIMGRGPSRDQEFERLVTAYTSEAAGGSWSSPTSRLLDVPGMDLMRSVPSIGGSLRGIDPSTLPPRPSSPEEERL